MLVRRGCILLLALDLLLGSLIYAKLTSADQTAAVFYPQLSGSGQEEELPVQDAYQDMKPKVALTYDDGPHPYYTEEILDVLSERGVRATFFVIGKSIDGREAILKRMQKEGHLICNHTYDHVDLSKLSIEQACSQLGMTSQCIEEVTGITPMFFRPPFGEWDRRLSDCTDMLPVLWTLDTKDWLTQNSEAAYRQVEGHVRENDIILLHDYYKETIQATEYIIDYLLEQGYDLVTVDELILE